MNDEVTRLLTEIRDDQREQLGLLREQVAYGRRAVEESMALQRLGLRRYKIGVGIAIGCAAVFLVILVIALIVKS